MLLKLGRKKISLLLALVTLQAIFLHEMFTGVIAITEDEN